MQAARIAVFAFVCASVPTLAAQVVVGPTAADARITSQPPDGLKPATGLSARDRRDSFEALWKAIDTTYAHFQLKAIDWGEVGRRYRARLDAVDSDAEFYRLLFRLVGELKDTHSWLQNYREPPLPQVTSVAVDLFDDRPFVVAVAAGSDAERGGVQPGWEVTAVDGLTVAGKMEVLRPLLGGFSSERAFRRAAARRLLAAEKPAPAIVVLRPPGGDARTVTLARDPGPLLRGPEPKPGFELTRTANVQFGVHPSGVGYIRILSFAAREPLDREFDAALEAMRDTPGLILDIRDNSGGFSHSWIIGRLFRTRTLTAISVTKDGPAHDAFRRQPEYNAPSGPWQYTRPVALLVNDLTASASDLFAAELRGAKRVTIVGSTTHGNLSGTAAYAVLPCNLVVRISNGYVEDATGRPVEMNGNVPDVAVAPSIGDVLAGRDPVLDKAIGLLTVPARKDDSVSEQHEAASPHRAGPTAARQFCTTVTDPVPVRSGATARKRCRSGVASMATMSGGR